MKHPTREEWMSYLYGESSATDCAEYAAHLRACPDCATKLSQWQAAQENLNTWPLPAKPRRAITLLHPAFKWAAAAAMVLGIGFGLGRFAAPATDVAQIRAAIQSELHRDLRQEFAQLLHEEIARATLDTLRVSGGQTEELLTSFIGALELQQAANQRATYTVLNELAAQHLADYLSLKKDLDTVAVNTDAGLRQAERQLIQLADYRPVIPSNSIQE